MDPRLCERQGLNLAFRKLHGDDIACFSRLHQRGVIGWGRGVLERPVVSARNETLLRMRHGCAMGKSVLSMRSGIRSNARNEWPSRKTPEEICVISCPSEKSPWSSDVGRSTGMSGDAETQDVWRIDDGWSWADKDGWLVLLFLLELQCRWSSRRRPLFPGSEVPKVIRGTLRWVAVAISDKEQAGSGGPTRV